MRRMVLRSLLVTPLLVLGACSSDETTTPEPVDPASPQGDGANAVIAEVQQVAPALESFVRSDPYPQTVEEAEAALADGGIALAPGHRIGGYVYDPEAVEFVLCVEDADGAWASYDTAPMGVRDSGAAGGCPAE